MTYPNDAIREVLAENARRADLSGAGDAAGGGGGRLHAGRGRPAAPGDGRLAAAGLIDQFRQKLIDGMRANGLPRGIRRAGVQQIRGFGEYGFPESHAASFALLVYVSAWLKHYYPAAFAAAMINSQPMGFYAAGATRPRRPRARRRGAAGGCELQRLGLHAGRSEARAGSRGVESRSRSELTICNPRLPQSSAPQLLPPPRPPHAQRPRRSARASRSSKLARAGPFTSIDDFARRTGLGQAVVKRLAEADAFGSLGADRRQALWQALGQEKKRRDDAAVRAARYSRPILGRCDRISIELIQQFMPSNAGQDGPAILPAMQLYEEVVADYRTAGLSLRAHPISFYREQLERLGITPARQLGGAGERCAGPRGRAGAVAAAARHGQGHHVRHARRRNRHGEPGRPSAHVGPLLPHRPPRPGLDRARPHPNHDRILRAGDSRRRQPARSAGRATAQLDVKSRDFR